MSRSILCPFCLVDNDPRTLLYRCSSHPQQCPQTVNKKLKELWGITTPSPLIFAQKKPSKSAAPCPQCASLTRVRCCLYCAQELHNNLMQKKCLHFACITHNTNGLALFYQAVYTAIETSLAHTKGLILEGPISPHAPFILHITAGGVPQTIILHTIAWEHLNHPRIQNLQTHTHAYAVFLPCMPESSLTPALHILQKNVQPKKKIAFVIQDSTLLLSHIPPDHIFFRHAPHHVGYNKQAALSLSKALQDMLIPFWGVHALEFINSMFSSPHFFVDTASLGNKTSLVPQGWKIEEFIHWFLEDFS